VGSTTTLEGNTTSSFLRQVLQRAGLRDGDVILVHVEPRHIQIIWSEEVNPSRCPTKNVLAAYVSCVSCTASGQKMMKSRFAKRAKSRARNGSLTTLPRLSQCDRLLTTALQRIRTDVESI